MKCLVKIIALVPLTLLLFHCNRNKTPEIINIPDSNFLNALIELGIDTDNDSLISREEAEFITSIDVSNKNIADLTGIEAFRNLFKLYCGQNELTSFDISENEKLVLLDCGINQLTSLDISHNKSLEEISCLGNKILFLNISKNLLLRELYLADNPLISLDCSNLANLETLECYDTDLTSLVLTNCRNLSVLMVHNNLQRIYHPQLAELDLSDCSQLELLWCDNNLLTFLDFSNCPFLTHLRCDGNQLTNLDISKNTRLEDLYIRDMPMLQKVCVWELPFPTTWILVQSSGSPNVYFTTDCGK
jgi:hypothetical protein